MTSGRLEFNRLFDAARTDPADAFDDERAYRVGDQFTKGQYVYDEDDEEFPGRIELAVNVALAAGRPLLVRGLPGTGKSSLAADVAHRLGWRYYEHVVSSRTQARDLLWTFDAVKRLGDAQAAGAQRGETRVELKPDAAYITPGVLWWAFDADSARRRGLAEDAFKAVGMYPADDPTIDRANADNGEPNGDDPSERAVVLIDEIDKADPDMPNDLLVPLGSFRFDVVFASELDVTVEARHAPLVVITTNEERDLPQAFIRRCVTLAIRPPGDERLLHIARAHFPDNPAEPTVRLVLEHYRKVQARREREGLRPASVAEFLDAVAACKALGTKPGDTALWKGVETLTMDKPDDATLGD